MQFSAILLPVAFGLAAAQYGDSSDSSSSASASTTASAAPVTFTSTAGVVTHKVAVGKNGLAFTPDSFAAAAGDAIEFHFYPNTHSVAAASFAEPCAPLNDTSFYSGGFTTAAGSVNSTVFTVMVNDTKPIWLYCGYPTHCQKGMVAVVNPPAASTNKTLDLFVKAAALTTHTTTNPQVQGGIKGAAASAASGTSSGTSTGTSTSSSSTATKSNAAVPLKATMGGVAGLLSLAFAGLIM